MPKINKTIAWQIYTLKKTRGKKFYLVKAYINGTHNPHMLCIFKKLLNFFRFFVPIGYQNLKHKTLFQIRFIIANQNLKCL